LDGKRHRPERAGDVLGARRLTPRRAGDPAEVREGAGEPGLLGLACSPHRAAAASAPISSGRTSRARPSAACTKSRNSGAGRSGLDLNSGWYCDATKNGWSLISITSTSRSSGDVPEQTKPAASSRLRRKLLTS